VPRPDQLILVTGTGTEVGKTWVASRLAADLLRRGVRVRARKPAQSFAPDERGSTDAEVLGAATGESPVDVCPRHRWYDVPMAPPMASDALGRPPIAIADLAKEIDFGADADIGLVETAGGVRSPLAHDGDTVDLAGLLRPDLVLLVADAGLGTLNAVRLSADAMKEWSLHVFLNRFDSSESLHNANKEWLTHHYGLQVTTEIAQLAATLDSTRRPL
jgi:dethiobiotin synthetase